MNTHRLGLAFLAAIIFSSISQAQIADRRCGVSELKFEATVDRPSILAAEPLVLKFVLRNLTSTPCLVHMALTTKDRSLSLYRSAMDGESGIVDALSGVPHLNTSHARDVVVDAGQAYEAQDVLAVGVESVLPKRGSYAMTAVVRDTDGNTLFSSSFTVTVVDPTDSRDIAAHKYLVTHGGTKAVMGGEISPAEFVEAFAGSEYGPYARFAFGEWLFYRREFAAAEEQFAEGGKLLAPPLMTEALCYLIQIKAELGDTLGAEKLLATLMNMRVSREESITAQRAVIRAHSKKELGLGDAR